MDYEEWMKDHPEDQQRWRTWELSKSTRADRRSERYRLAQSRLKPSMDSERSIPRSGRRAPSLLDQLRNPRHRRGSIVLG